MFIICGLPKVCEAERSMRRSLVNFLSELPTPIESQYQWHKSALSALQFFMRQGRTRVCRKHVSYVRKSVPQFFFQRVLFE